MKELMVGVGEPFLSPAWGSNLVVFSGQENLPVPEDDVKAYLSRACKYAKHYQVYLVPERFMLMGYQCMCLIGPDGKVIGAQKGMFLSSYQKKPSAKRSANLELLDTEFGGVCLCVDVDIYHPEVARIAASMGAQILIVSQHISGRDYYNGMVLAGCWNVAQANNLLVVDVCNQFHCVCAPLVLTPHNDGFISPPNLKMPMSARLNTKHLEACPQRFLLSRKLYAVHRGELTK